LQQLTHELFHKRRVTRLRYAKIKAVISNLFAKVKAIKLSEAAAAGIALSLVWKKQNGDAETGF
jgi:hypothetical protein